MTWLKAHRAAVLTLLAMPADDIDCRVVVDATPALIFSARPDGFIDYFNRRWLDRLGVPLAAIEGWGWTRFIHPDDLEGHLHRWRAAMVSSEVHVSQARVRRADGEYQWMLHRAEALRDEAGHVVRWFGSSVESSLPRLQAALGGQGAEGPQPRRLLRLEVARARLADCVFQAIVDAHFSRS